MTIIDFKFQDFFVLDSAESLDAYVNTITHRHKTVVCHCDMKWRPVTSSIFRLMVVLDVKSGDHQSHSDSSSGYLENQISEQSTQQLLECFSLGQWWTSQPTEWLVQEITTQEVHLSSFTGHSAYSLFLSWPSGFLFIHFLQDRFK